MPITPLNSILPSDIIHLGFGCGGLLHGLTPSESLRLVETALDCGITYFDTARMYGFGGAEAVLGTLAPRQRDRIIIASKAGILPPNRSIPLRAVSRGVKLLHKALPQLKGRVTAPAAIHPRFGVFDLPNLSKSVETSLRELRTDYLDIFLLHECTEMDVKDEELLYFLQRLRTQGKIRAFGLATGIEETIRILNARPALGSVVQIANSIWNMNIKRLPLNADRLTITHSTLTSRFQELTRQISSNGSVAKQWKSAIEIDPRDKTALAQLLLAHALRSNTNGVVLFFSSNLANIKASIRVALEKPFSDDQIDGLDALMKNKEAMLPLEGIHRDHLSVS